MPQSYIGIDYGLRRVGLAIGDSVTGAARPLATLSRDFDAILREIRRWQPSACVVGLPLTDDGREQPMTATARRFARRLAQHVDAEVHLVDERMSSVAAASMIRAERDHGTRTGRVRREHIDSQAACLILQQWMDEHA